MPEIRLRNVYKNFGQVVAVDNLTLELPEHSFVTLLGPSGCGKTTTLRMIAGLEMPTQGEIRIGERVLSSSTTLEAVPPEQRGMGLVFQSYALWPHMTVAENITFGLQMQRKSRREQKQRLDELIGLLHIEGLQNRYPLQLSGGQQQRVALARMLAISPQVLLLDEPLSNLDARLRMEMRAELKRLHEQLGNTIIYVTHDQLEAMTMASHIAVIHQGRLQQFASPMEIYCKPANLFVAEFVGSPSINIFTVDSPSTKLIVTSILDHLRRHNFNQNQDTYSQVKTIGIRPEAIKIISPRSEILPGSWSYPVTVDTVLPTGPEWIISLRIEEKIIFITTNQEPRLSTHQPAMAIVNLQQIHFFDYKDQYLQNPISERPSMVGV